MERHRKHWAAAESGFMNVPGPRGLLLPSSTPETSACSAPSSPARSCSRAQGPCMVGEGKVPQGWGLEYLVPALCPQAGIWPTHQPRTLSPLDPLEREGHPQSISVITPLDPLLPKVGAPSRYNWVGCRGGRGSLSTCTRAALGLWSQLRLSAVPRSDPMLPGPRPRTPPLSSSWASGPWRSVAGD